MVKWLSVRQDQSLEIMAANTSVYGRSSLKGCVLVG